MKMREAKNSSLALRLAPLGSAEPISRTSMQLKASKTKSVVALLISQSIKVRAKITEMQPFQS